ncbi:hypothetical protein [Thiosocius teredinicola]|uniref:hypothetical protein n=1 Tax=Thiosocius teredinicola TaxID=1973002 RepID=UPI0013DDD15E
MHNSPYLMRDLNGRKVDNIMNFNVAMRQNRSRSILEISVFAAAVAGYVLALALGA